MVSPVGRRAAGLFLAALLAFPLAAEGPGPWVEGALAALRDGRLADAGDIARAALGEDSTNSDLLYVAARADYGASGKVRPALAELELALAASRFATVPRDDCLSFQAELLLRLRLWNEALRALDGLGRLSADAELARASALLGLGDRTQALSRLERAAAAWPKDSRFAKLFFSRGGFGPDERARRLASVFLRAPYLRASGQTPPMPEALAFIADERERRSLVGAWRASRGPVATAEALRYGLLGEAAAVDEAFAGASSFDASWLESFAGLLGGGEGLARLEAALASFEGRILRDSDGDGFPESETLYSRGLPVEFRLDADQDGESETVVEFSRGEAAHASLLLSGAGVSAAWADWPSLSAVEWRATRRDPAGRAEPRDEIVTSYDLVPDSLVWRGFEARPFPSLASGFTLLLPASSPFPTERALASASRELLRETANGTLRVTMRDGLAVEGRISRGGREFAFLEFSLGRAVREGLDQDGDGRFETILALDPSSPPMEPSPTSFRSDLDGDGVYEYSEELFPPFRKTWDYNADGVADAIETRGSDGGLERLFSSRLDGRMDEGILLGPDGLFLSILRDGRPPLLVQDRNPGLRWVGAKPFDLGSAMPGEEGLYVAGSLRYRLMRAGALWFAEILR